jgi:hypothetical protein
VEVKGGDMGGAYAWQEQGESNIGKCRGGGSGGWSKGGLSKLQDIAYPKVDVPNLVTL